MDPLSEVLSRLRPGSPIARLATDHGAWCVRFPAHGYIKCYAVLSGSCWIAVDDREPVALSAGDCVLLPGGRGFRLGSDLRLPAVDIEQYRQHKASAATPYTHRGSGQVTFIGSAFTLPGPQAAFLLDALPPLIHLKWATGQAPLRWYLERMEQELREHRLGARLVAEHLAQLFLVEALREHLNGAGPGQLGWLSALADAELRASISAMHADPTYAWTVGRLAQQAGLSRSTFSARFKACMGVGPIAYLTKWRMLLAADRLASGQETVAGIALTSGYESEAAFSTAFKRVMGSSPRRYSGQPRQRVAGPPT